MKKTKSEPIITVSNITKSFGKNKVLKDISLELFAGEILGLIGRSGCGKSTLIKILVGYYKADSGKIIFNNRNVTKSFQKARSMVGYTTQENSFYEKLTIFENMKYYSNLYDIKNKEERIKFLLESVNLFNYKDLAAEKISGGMKRRLDFAISMLHDPKLVILDEPTTGLDPILIENFWKTVRKIAKEHEIAVLVSSHILSEIKGYCDKVAVVSEGKISKITKIKKSTDLNKMFDKLRK